MSRPLDWSLPNGERKKRKASVIVGIWEDAKASNGRVYTYLPFQTKKLRVEASKSDDRANGWKTG